MDKLLQDLRYAVRMLRKAPGFTTLVVLIVAIGVGAGATIFSIVETALIADENPNSSRWYAILRYFPRQNLRGHRWSGAEYFDFRQLTDVFERVGAVSGGGQTLFLDNYPEIVDATRVTADMIPMTATAPLKGRIFTADDDRPGAPLTTVITYELWQRRFHGDANILGRSLKLNDRSYTVIGVMPPRYGLWGGELYIPFQLDPADHDRSTRWMWVSVILRHGVSEQQAARRVAEFARAMERDHTGTNPEYQGLQLSLWNVKEAVIAGVRPALLILMGAVGLIVAISCANIGNLLLARASSRRREMSLRAALGAPRGRIIRQLLTESLLLSLCGGALGVLLALWGVPAAVAMVPTDQLPGASVIHLDSGAVLMSFAIATLMGLVFGLAPALYSVRGDLARAIREGGWHSGASREGRFTRSGFVVSQIALAMIVLAGAGLMLRTYQELLRIDTGYDTRNVIISQLTLPPEVYTDTGKIRSFYRELMPRLAALPGVDGAAVSTGRPLMDRTVDIPGQDFFLAGHEGEKTVPNANFRVITPNYFQATGTRLLRGRAFTDADTATSDAVIIVNQTMAQLYWPNSDPVGQSVRLGAHDLGPDDARGRWVRIVGVVADAHQVRIIEYPVRQEMFFPLAQRPEPARSVSVIVRSRQAPDTLAAAVRHAVAAVDPERPIFATETMQQALSDSFGPKRLATFLLGAFAAIALTLAGVGLYAIMAYSVVQRTRDLGIRMALGAQPADVLRLVLREGLRLALVGIAIGIVGALGATRAMHSLIYEVSPSDPLTYAAVGVVLALVTVAASYFPARRATRTDPMIALRYE